MNHIVVDVETTGFSQHHHAIVEVAGIVVTEDGFGARFESKCNPGEDYLFDREAQVAFNVNGLDPKQLVREPKSMVVAGRFRAWLGQQRPYLLWAYNYRFDQRMLKVAPWNIPDTVWSTVDLLDAAWELMRVSRLGYATPMKKPKAEQALQSLEITRIGRAHSAMSDVMAEGEILRQHFRKNGR